MDVMSWVWISLGILVLLIVMAQVKIVSQSNAFIIERLGSYKQTWNTGLHIKIPFIERVAKVVLLKEQVADFPPQPVITKDMLLCKLTRWCFFKLPTRSCLLTVL